MSLDNVDNRQYVLDLEAAVATVNRLEAADKQHADDAAESNTGEALNSTAKPDEGPPVLCDEACVLVIGSFGKESELYICPRLEVVALTRNDVGEGWGYLLQFNDPDGAGHELNVPMSMLSTDGG